MQGTPTVPETGKISVYLPKEDWDYILENYQIISGSDEALPWGKFIMKAMVAAMATRKPDSNPDDKKRILELVGQVDSFVEENHKLKKAIEIQLKNYDELLSSNEDTIDIASYNQLRLELEVKTNEVTSILDAKNTFERDLNSLRLSNALPEGQCH